MTHATRRDRAAADPTPGGGAAVTSTTPADAAPAASPATATTTTTSTGAAATRGTPGAAAVSMTPATPATRALAAAGVPFTVHTYTHDPRAASFGLEAAQELGVGPERVLKTLVVGLDGGGFGVTIVPVADRLDLKAAARLLGSGRAALAEPATAQRVTGYVVGGISPFGQKRALPTAIEEAAATHESVFVSGGRRGLDVELAPADLVALLDARVGPLARRKDAA